MRVRDRDANQSTGKNASVINPIYDSRANMASNEIGNGYVNVQ